MQQPTPWYKSRTFALGVLALVIAVLTDPAVLPVMPLDWGPRLTAIVAVAAILHRTLKDDAADGEERRP